jgi:hypothetical protein
MGDVKAYVDVAGPECGRKHHHHDGFVEVVTPCRLSAPVGIGLSSSSQSHPSGL